MSYEPKEWVCGDTITAEELNRMEEGISSASGGIIAVPLVVDTETYTNTIQMPWKDIYDALGEGKLIVVFTKATTYGSANRMNFISSAYRNNNNYDVCITPSYGGADVIQTATATSESGFPSWQDD